jgi:hypothetical protein
MIVLATACQPERPDSGYSAPEIVRKANVVYDSAAFQTGHMHIPPYIANGVIGGCFDHMGFQHQPNKGTPGGRTALGYADHYYMHTPTSRQAQLPLAWIEAGFTDGSGILNMMDVTGYRQELDLYSGTLTTRYDLFGPTEIVALAHQTLPGLFLMKITRKADSPEKQLVVKISCETSVTQQSNIAWPPDPVQVQVELVEGRAEVISTTNMVSTRWTVAGNATIELAGDQLLLRCREEETIVRILVHREDTDASVALGAPFEDLVHSHEEEWSRNWERSWVHFPEDRAHFIWNRANYYNLSNFPVVAEKALIPTGMNSNIWGFTFPQDVYYVAENLLRSGHFERYAEAMKYWLDILPEVKKYSVRVMEVEGGFYPWTPPFDRWEEFEKDGAVSNDSYELHNPAYVSAMVWHYYQRTLDTAFLRQYFPIMEEVFRFYSNVTHPNDRGTWDVNHHKAAGQDEANRLESSKNLLCASYSAEYSTRNYAQAADILGTAEPPLLEKARTILAAGFERETLLKSEGYYRTYEGDVRPKNSQKHPVQLNAITFCPMGDLGTAPPSLRAWEHRYDLTTQARKPVSHGWTFAAYALSSSRLGQPGGLARDLSAIQYCANADPRWIQFFEFTFWERYTLHLSYYFPTQGLYQQAFTDALVQDWQGHTELFGCMLQNWRDDRVAFRGLHTLNGVSVDGEWNRGKIRVKLTPSGNRTAIRLRVAGLNGMIRTEGQKGKTDRFVAGEIVELAFEGDRPIVLYN